MVNAIHLENMLHLAPVLRDGSIGHIRRRMWNIEAMYRDLMPRAGPFSWGLTERALVVTSQLTPTLVLRLVLRLSLSLIPMQVVTVTRDIVDPFLTDLASPQFQDPVVRAPGVKILSRTVSTKDEAVPWSTSGKARGVSLCRRPRSSPAGSRLAGKMPLPRAAASVSWCPGVGRSNRGHLTGKAAALPQPVVEAHTGYSAPSFRRTRGG